MFVFYKETPRTLKYSPIRYENDVLFLSLFSFSFLIKIFYSHLTSADKKNRKDQETGKLTFSLQLNIEQLCLSEISYELDKFPYVFSQHENEK
mgnify:FL=1